MKFFLFLTLVLICGCQPTTITLSRNANLSTNADLIAIDADLSQITATDPTSIKAIKDAHTHVISGEKNIQTSIKSAEQLQNNYDNVIKSFRYKCGGWIVGIIWIMCGVSATYGVVFLLSLLFPANIIICSIWKLLTFGK